MRRCLAALEALIVREPSAMIGCRLGGRGPEQWFPADYYTVTVGVPFEGRQLTAPAQYDRILRSLYGDYLVLPPTHLQESNHSFVAYRLE